MFPVFDAQPPVCAAQFNVSLMQCPRLGVQSIRESLPLVGVSPLMFGREPQHLRIQSKLTANASTRRRFGPSRFRP